MNYKSFAIIVTYNPDNSILDTFISSLLPQVAKVVIIDNSEASSVNNHENVEVIRLNENIGIAAAQNIGLKEAIDAQCDFIFTFDQDSCISESYCSDMISQYIFFSKNHPVGCLGPSINVKRNQLVNMPLVEKDFIISSGALFPVVAFEKVGLFKAEWFIDMIDVEWSYRARSKGMLSYESPNVVMQHNIGENDYPKLFNREVRIGSPVRQYYLIRNWIFSLRSDSFDFKYKIYIITLMLKKIPLFCLLSPRKKRVQYILKGIADGLSGKGGKCSS
ncbi:glycosyltransferase family 2 protein [Enterobacteriaceae bacterium C34A]